MPLISDTSSCRAQSLATQRCRDEVGLDEFATFQPAAVAPTAIVATQMEIDESTQFNTDFMNGDVRIEITKRPLKQMVAKPLSVRQMSSIKESDDHTASVEASLKRSKSRSGFAHRRLQLNISFSYRRAWRGTHQLI